jgi:hypothetical protein
MSRYAFWNREILWGAFSILLVVGVITTHTSAETTRPTSPDTSSEAKSPSEEAEYELRYKFQLDEVIKTKVVHLATTETTIRGSSQSSRSRSVSTKVWKITDIDESGNVTFEHSVEKVEMWQHVTGRDEVTYNSETDEKPPLEYELAAETIGVPLAIVTVDPHGEIVERKDLKQGGSNLGLGQITTPLPAGRVKIGAQWHFPTEIAIYLPDGQLKRIKTRQQYTLKSVKTDVATITVKTQVLTPVNDPKIESQLVQQLTNGEFKFDLQAGRILSKKMDWDEVVVGFSGAESTLKYLARFTEDYLPGENRVATRPRSQN